MTILDPVCASNLAVCLLQLPRSRTATRKQSVVLPVEFLSLEQARAAGGVIITETGITERIRLENLSGRDLFLQAGEVLRGGYQDRAVAGNLIVPAPRHEPKSAFVPVFCVEEHRWREHRGADPEAFYSFDQMTPGRRLKKKVRLGTQEDVWREVAAINDALIDRISYGGMRDMPPMSLWGLLEMVEVQGHLNEYLYPLLPLAETHQEATGAVSVLNGKLNSAEMYATPALFRQLWPKLLWSMAVEALTEQKNVGAWTGKLPAKGEVTAWLANAHGRRAARHTDKINQRVHRRIRSSGGVFCFETLDQEQDGLCVHETILPNE